MGRIHSTAQPPKSNLLDSSFCIQLVVQYRLWTTSYDFRDPTPSALNRRAGKNARNRHLPQAAGSRQRPTPPAACLSLTTLDSLSVAATSGTEDKAETEQGQGRRLWDHRNPQVIVGYALAVNSLLEKAYPHVAVGHVKRGVG